MDFIPQVECPRFGSEYSSLQSKCPKCGARKIKQTQRAPGTTSGTVAGTYANDQAQVNARWQMTFAAILVVAVILAMIVLISTSLNTTPGSSQQQGGDVQQTTVDPNATPTPTPTPSPSPSPTPDISSLTLSYAGSKIEQFTEAIGDKITLSITYYPLDAPVTTDTIIWKSQNEEVCTVEGDNTGCIITGVGVGSTNVTATLYDETVSVLVFVKESW